MDFRIEELENGWRIQGSSYEGLSIKRMNKFVKKPPEILREIEEFIAQVEERRNK